MLNKFNWAILGCGSIANDFARDVTQMGGEIYSVANRTYEKAVSFAKKYNIEIIPVLNGDISESAFTGDAEHINSGFLDGLGKEEAINKMLDYLEENKLGKKSVNYKLRDKKERIFKWLLISMNPHTPLANTF